jgi:hypothetical protein
VEIDAGTVVNDGAVGGSVSQKGGTLSGTGTGAWQCSSKPFCVTPLQTTVEIDTGTVVNKGAIGGAVYQNGGTLGGTCTVGGHLTDRGNTDSE